MEALLEATGDLCVLDESGDNRIQWDRYNPEQVAAAKARFDELKSKRYLAYRVSRGGWQGEVIDKFDPNAERIIMNAQMVGG
jgi:hypothetical protein